MNADKERILMTIITRMAKLDLSGYDEKQGFPRVSIDEPKPGDLVVCKSSGPHPYAVGWAVSEHDPHGAALTIREIGTERTCHVSNDSFYVLKGFGPDAFLEGKQRGLRDKVMKAFRRGDEYAYRYGGLSFPEPGVAVLLVREVWGGLAHKSLPFPVEIKWNSRTSIKAILQAMRDAGYGTRVFDLAPVDNPPPAQ